MFETRSLPRAARVALITAAGHAAALGLVALWKAGASGAGIDHFQYWAAGQAVRERLVPDLYAPGAGPDLARIFLQRAAASDEPRFRAAASFRRQEIQIASPPLLFALVNLVPQPSFERAITIHRAIGLLGTLAALAFVGYGLAWPPEATLSFIAAGSWLLQPWRDDLLDGNVAGWQMAMLAFYLALARGKSDQSAPILELSAGAALGFLVAFKPNLAAIPATLAIALIAHRLYRSLFLRASGLALGGALAFAIGSIWFGTASAWISWWEALRELESRFDVSVAWGNFAGGRMLREWAGVNASPGLALAAFGLLAFALWKGRATPESGLTRRGQSQAPPHSSSISFQDEVLLAGIGAALPILCSNLAWPHYLVLVLPLLMRLLTPGVSSRRERAGAAAGFALMASNPLLRVVGFDDDHLLAGMMLAGTALLFLLGCRALAAPSGIERARRADAQGAGG